ncbi:SRPBCC family protein [Domibacillus enclensis]|uniref:ATPase n=1 Tax=Domibacillus enclensis TaxID=1017273 RepID=A0A1N7AE64_9BACI|nr:SRPBCC domain-containing protein [Domibacillus enclensis]OXS75789.1 ATPase [Domibacillus enclensis]SIR37346.1 Uncharacterized conserved protein YndB, AHSA1/START domain [Domibacillus enclensis]
MSDQTVMVKVEGSDLIMERIVAAPRDLVFQVFSSSDHVEAWWGPAGWETENRQFEFKPGGVWHYCMRCTDKDQGDFYGMESWGKGVFHEIVPPEKIVYTDYFSDEQGSESKEMPSTHSTILFEEIGEETKLIFRSRYASEEALQQVMDMGMVQGFSSQLEHLDQLLAKLQSKSI